MFKQLFQSFPVSFRIVWALAFLASVGIIGFVCWAIYRFVVAYT